MGYRYAILGAGRQGTAAAYDLARFGEADFLLLADQSLAQAESAMARVNSLIGRKVAHARQVAVEDEDAVVQLLTTEGIQVFISGAYYRLACRDYGQLHRSSADATRCHSG